MSGLHQPAKAKGGYVMTDFARLLRGGESADNGELSIVPGDPDKSLLIHDIIPSMARPRCPKEAPLAEKEIALIRRWVAEGAIDDTPANARQHVDAEHPPVYHRPPLVTSLTSRRWIAPRSRRLSRRSALEARWLRTARALIGLSDRIQTVRFSPDGKYLAACGGRPAQMGEDPGVGRWKPQAQAERTFRVRHAVRGQLVSRWQAALLRLPDNTLRAIDADHRRASASADLPQ
jgi:hypothetical protein